VNKKVTVIIPVFNRFNVADRAIMSVINQTYLNWELYVIDDYSSENYILPHICEIATQKIKLFRNEKNLGPGLSRQKGLDLALGEFICFLDSDDYWLPNFLQTSMESHAKSNYTVGATYCQTIMTDGTLRRRNEVNESVDNIFVGVVSGVRPWATGALVWNKRYIACWSELRTNQDAYFELESSRINSKVQFIPEKLCVIDKNTGQNAVDLVERGLTIKNNITTLIKANQLIRCIEIGQKNQVNKILIIRSLKTIKKILFTKYFLFCLISLVKIMFYQTRFFLSLSFEKVLCTKRK
jgi:glycosyltransferase involved in cell wall biosynthesis